jgi:hypothetical protein
MKKTRKFLAAILTAATVFSMSVIPAFATSETTSSEATAITELKFTKTFTSENNGSLPNASFDFTMTPATPDAGSKYEGLEVVTGLPLEKNDATVSFTATTGSTETGTGTFNFGLADSKTFSGPKAYCYEIQEVIPSSDKKDTSIKYDDTKYTVYLLVDNSNNVTAVVNVSSTKAGEDGTDTKTDINEKVAKKPIAFENKCHTDNLRIEKKVTGSMGSKTDKFTFQLLIPVKGGTGGHTIAEGTTYTGKIYRKATGTSTETVDIKVKDTLGTTENTFELADGDYLSIDGLPEATIYTVTELGAADYNTSIEGTFSSDDTEVIKKENGKVYNANEKGTPIVDGGNTLVFTNKKDITPTGLVVAYGPQILVLLIAIGGALVIFKTRRKVER